MEKLAAAVELKEGVLRVLLALAAALSVGTIVRVAWHAVFFRDAADRHPERIASLTTWWVLAVLLAAGLLTGRGALTGLMGLLSLLALREFLLLTGAAGGWRLLVWTAPLVGFNYLCVHLGWFTLFLVFVPLGMLVVLGGWAVFTATTSGFLRRVPLLHWGLMLTVFCPAHAAWLAALPETSNATGGPAGWLLFLVLLTVSNDIVQALAGRSFGSRRLAPRISPHKTWEGFLGGLVATPLLAVVLAGELTPLATPFPRTGGTGPAALPFLPAVTAGVLIALSGTLGDLHVSALKRDLGVKDTGRALPGHGGILDRLDSLTFSAPVFCYFVLWIYVDG